MSQSNESSEARYSATDNLSFMYQLYCSYMILFKNDGGIDDFMPLPVLKRGLELLVRKHYPPVAGWFDVQGLEIDVVYYSDKFNDPPFTSQTLDISYDEAARHVSESNEEMFVPKAPSGVISSENKNIPMFLAKATYLTSNQGMVLGVNYHHSLMDGASFWNFMQNWAYLCNRLSRGDSEIEELPSQPTFGFPDISRFEDTSKVFDHTEYVTTDPDSHTLELLPGKDKIKENRLVVSFSQQQELRKLAKQHGVSFHVILCAILWKELSTLRLQAKPAIAEDVSQYTCAVNPRQALGIPGTLCASAVINVAARRTVSQVAEMDLGQIAAHIQQTLARVTPAYMCSSHKYLRALKEQELDNAIHGRAGKRTMFSYIHPAAVKCTVSSSRTFPIYRLDFGSGSPEYVRPPYLPFDGCVRFWPGPPSSDSGADLELYISQPENIDLGQSDMLRPFIGEY
ncbi:hypothetical protein EC988_001829 [Linderina pennispora]|nr:hypothetical protein EC988_001829 [Linderina pennispora]